MKNMICKVFNHKKEMYLNKGYWMHKCNRCDFKEMLFKESDFGNDKY